MPGHGDGGIDARGLARTYSPNRVLQILPPPQPQQWWTLSQKKAGPGVANCSGFAVRANAPETVLRYARLWLITRATARTGKLWTSPSSSADEGLEIVSLLRSLCSVHFHTLVSWF